MNKLHNIVWTAIVTPLDRHGKVDYVSFEKILRTQEEAGNGVVILGSTGEALNLASAEKNQIIKFSTELGLKIPMICGMPGHQLDETLEWIKRVEDHAFDGYLMVTPIYAKPGASGQSLWFESLMNASTRPCMLYNVPGRSAVALHTDSLKNLKDHPRFWALKEASGDVAKYSQYRQIIPNHALYSGDDGMIPFFAQIGCQGVVSVASNCWPKETRLYTRLSLEGKGQEVFPLWEKACNALFLASNPVPVKALMAHKNMIQTPMLKAPLHHEDFHHMETLHQLDLKVANWYKERA